MFIVYQRFIRGKDDMSNKIRGVAVICSYLFAASFVLIMPVSGCFYAKESHKKWEINIKGKGQNGDT